MKKKLMAAVTIAAVISLALSTRATAKTPPTTVHRPLT